VSFSQSLPFFLSTAAINFKDREPIISLMEEDNPFPRVLKIHRLFAEEQPGEIAEPEPASFEELQELPRSIKMLPLSEKEEEKTPDVQLDFKPDPALDDPVINDRMKSVDDYVDTKFLKDNVGKLLRPWDEVELN
jgi:hypothetical protein